MTSLSSLRRIHRDLFLVAAVLLVMAALTSSAFAFGNEECRKPTPEEKAAVDKLVGVLKQEIITPLLASQWLVAGQKSAENMEVTVANGPVPPRPLMDCTTLFDYRLGADPNSKHGQEYQAAMKNFTAQNMKEVLPLMASAQVHIRVGENNPTLAVPHVEQYKPLDVQGPAVAYQIPDKDANVATVLCYGGFKRELTFSKQSTRVMYPFVHKQGTPFIENFCVNIRTSQTVTDEILKLVNWEKLKLGLTP